MGYVSSVEVEHGDDGGRVVLSIHGLASAYAGAATGVPTAEELVHGGVLRLGPEDARRLRDNLDRALGELPPPPPERYRG